MANLLKQNLQLVRALLRGRGQIHEQLLPLPPWRVAGPTRRTFANDARKDGLQGSLSDSIRSSLLSVWRDRDRASKKVTEKKRDKDHEIAGYEHVVPQIISKLQFVDRMSKDQKLDALTEHLRLFGYTLRVRHSDVPGAGRGVFLAMGNFERGEVLCLYPGTVYTITRLLEIATLENMNDGIMGPPAGPMLPPFMRMNSYLLQERVVMAKGGDKVRVDLLADGNPYGQSALRFLKEIESEAADSSWLELQTENPPRDREHRTDVLLNDKGVGKDDWAERQQPRQFGMLGRRSFLSLGHLFNHCPRHLQPHVRFVFVPLCPDDVPPHLLRHLPSTNARPDRARRWAIAAVALRPAERAVEHPSDPLELFSTFSNE